MRGTQVLPAEPPLLPPPSPTGSDVTTAVAHLRGDDAEVFWDVSPPTYRLVWCTLLLLYVLAEVYLLAIAGGYVMLMYVPSFSYCAATFHLIPVTEIPIVIALYGVVATMYTAHVAQFVYCSLWHRVLLFLSSALASIQHLKQGEAKSKPSFIIRQLSTAKSVTTSTIAKGTRWLQQRVLSSSGFCGVRGAFFEPVVMLRELVEIAIQTSQAYQCSKQTTKFWVNATFAILIVVNCYSSPLLHRFEKASASAYRVTVLSVDLALDLVWFAVIPTLLWYPYFQALRSGGLVLCRDTYIIEGIMEIPVLAATSYSDALVKLWPPVSIFFTLRKLELPARRARAKHLGVKGSLAKRSQGPHQAIRAIAPSDALGISKPVMTRDRVEKWPHVTTLLLDHGNFSEYPMVLSKMPALETISFFSNHISHIPDSAFEANRGLRFLVLSKNPLTSLPSSLATVEILVHVLALWTYIQDVYTPLANGSASMLSQLRVFGFETPVCTHSSSSSSSSGQVPSQLEEAPWLTCEDKFSLYNSARSYAYYPLEAKLAEKQFVSG